MRVNRFVKQQPAPSAGEHICGVLVRARPERIEVAVAGLARLPGVEVHERTADGRLVVTVEDTPESTAADTLHKLHGVDGVIAASLVYHYHDTGDQGEASS